MDISSGGWDQIMKVLNTCPKSSGPFRGLSHLDLYYGYRKYFLVLALQKQTETAPPHEHQTRHYACLGDAPREY